jgi:predicted RNA-binding protein with PIN domain
MNYIVDGHNLISKLSGLSLSMPDDEERLIEVLEAYSKQRGHRVEVYFDKAPIGQAGVQNYGLVKAHFVSEKGTADDAIHKRLARLGKAARNWVLVSSDRSVQAAGHTVHASVVSSEEFASQLEASKQASREEVKPGEDKPLTEAEVRQWEQIFKRKR